MATASTLELLKSSNKLRSYAFIICSYLVLAFVGLYVLWDKIFSKFTSFCYLTKLNDSNINVCPYRIEFDFESFESISLVTSGVFLCYIMIHLTQLISATTLSRVSNLNYAAYCSLLINVVAFCSHISMAKGWYPIIISVWGRVSHVSRWIEWITVAPALMIMMHSSNIKNYNDKRLLWESTFCQFISVFLGAISSFIQNFQVATILLGLSIIFYLHIYFVVYKAYESYQLLLSSNKLKKVNILNSPKINKQSTLLRRSVITNMNDFRTYPVTPESTSGRSTPELIAQEFFEKEVGVSTRQLFDELEITGSIIFIKLAFFCALTWTCKVIIYVISALGIISNTSESILQSLFDCISKGLYARALRYNGLPSSTIDSEQLVSSMSLMETQANTSIRQFLRFVFHEISTPLNTLSMCLNNIDGDERLPLDLSETVNTAKEECNNISETLFEMLSFQEVEEGQFVIITDPVSIKDLVKNLSNNLSELARTRGLSVYTSFDSNIPSFVMADKLRLSRAFLILIQHSVEYAKYECTISTQLINLGKFTALIRITVRDDSDGYTSEEIEKLFNPYDKLTYGNDHKDKYMKMGLSVAKQIIELHGGILSVDSKQGYRTAFNCDILFSLPKIAPSTEYEQNLNIIKEKTV